MVEVLPVFLTVLTVLRLSRLTPASSSQVGLLEAFLIISDNTPYENELLTAVNIFNRREMPQMLAAEVHNIEG